MKGLRSRIFRTFKSFSHGSGHKAQSRVIHVDVPDEFFDAEGPSPAIPSLGRTVSVLSSIEEEHPKPEYGLALKSSTVKLESLVGSWDLADGVDDDKVAALDVKPQLGNYLFPNQWKEFSDRCPPGGKDVIVLYTTSLRGIRKTFENCRRVRLVLENLMVEFQERDVSMDLGYREELWKVMGRRMVPPRLFIRGVDVGGAEDVISLHENGKLEPMLKAVRRRRSSVACVACGGMRFIVCTECSGSRKMYDGERCMSVRCWTCNENGLVACPLCG